jgi:urease accessory protein
MLSTSRAPVIRAAGAVLASLLLAQPASAHHLMGLFHLQPGPLAGLLSGLAHPLLGPDHLLFLLAVGLTARGRDLSWLLGLLVVSLAGSALGLVLPGFPAAEPLVALSLVVQGLVAIGVWPRWTLLPAFALHGYVLSAAVLGWGVTAIGLYLCGLLLSQAALLVVALTRIGPWARRLAPGQLRLIAGVLIGVGGGFAWSALVP